MDRVAAALRTQGWCFGWGGGGFVIWIAHTILGITSPHYPHPKGPTIHLFWIHKYDRWSEAPSQKIEQHTAPLFLAVRSTARRSRLFFGSAKHGHCPYVNGRMSRNSCENGKPRFPT